MKMLLAVAQLVLLSRAAGHWSWAVSRNDRDPLPAPACSLRVSSTHELHTASGQKVYANVLSAARSGGRSYLAGQPVFPWPIADTTVQDSLFGVVADDSGVVELVAAPHPGVRPKYPHIFPVPGGVEAIYFEGDPGDGHDIRSENSGSFWHGRYVGGRWRDVRRIHSVARAQVATYLTSALRHRGELQLVYSAITHDPTRTQSTKSAWIRLRESRGQWRADTIPSGFEIFRAKMANAGEQVVLGGSVPLATRFGRAGNSVPQFAVATGSGPRLGPLTAFASERSEVPDLMLLGGGHGFVTWDQGGAVLLRRFLIRRDRLVPFQADTLGRWGTPFVGSLDARTAVVVGLSAAGLAGYRVTAESLEPLAPAPMPGMRSLWPVSLGLSRDRFLFVGTTLTPDRPGQGAASHLMHLRIACK